MKLFLPILIFFTVSLFILPPKTFASRNFKTSSNVVYTIQEDGTTHTTFTIILENTTSQYYATQYNLFVGFNKIGNLSVKDSGGAVKTSITPKDHGNSIHMTFNNKVIG